VIKLPQGDPEPAASKETTTNVTTSTAPKLASTVQSSGSGTQSITNKTNLL
jgi:hypothetical protein